MPGSPAARDPAGYAGLPVGAFLDALAAASPAPAAGSAAALVLAQAAALCAKSARLSARQLGEGKAAELTAAAERVRAAATALIDADAVAYQGVIAAARVARAARHEASGHGGPATAPASAAAGSSPAPGAAAAAPASSPATAAAAGRGEAAGRLAAAWSRAADVPMEVVALAAELAGPAAALTAGGNPNLRGDARTAVLLSQAAARSAARLVTINLAGAAGDPRPARAASLLARVSQLTTETDPLSP